LESRGCFRKARKPWTFNKTPEKHHCSMWATTPSFRSSRPMSCAMLDRCRSEAESAMKFADALTLTTLRGVRVVAGRAGLARDVLGVHVVDFPNPVPWVRAGQILLTTGYAWPHDAGSLRTLIRDGDCSTPCPIWHEHPSRLCAERMHQRPEDRGRGIQPKPAPVCTHPNRCSSASIPHQEASVTDNLVIKTR
jgi:Purine catabolism regulatory protein-like family